MKEQAENSVGFNVESHESLQAHNLQNNLQLAAQSSEYPKMSDFYVDLKSLVKFYEERIPLVEPFFLKESWDKRKKQLTDLKSALKIVEISGLDFHLFQLCRTIASEEGSVYYYFSKWNDFPLKIQDLLNKYMQQSDLTINLLVENVDMTQKYQQLFSQYANLLQQFEKIKLELEKSQSSHANEKTIATYMGLQSLRNQVIHSLKDEIQVEKMEHQKLTQTHSDALTSIEVYKKQNKMLIKQLEDTNKQVAKLILEAKVSADKADLYRQQVNRLTGENSHLQKELETKDAEVKDLHVKVQKSKKASEGHLQGFFNAKNYLTKSQINKVNQFDQTSKSCSKDVEAIQQKLNKMLKDAGDKETSFSPGYKQ